MKVSHALRNTIMMIGMPHSVSRRVITRSTSAPTSANGVSWWLATDSPKTSVMIATRPIC